MNDAEAIRDFSAVAYLRREQELEVVRAFGGGFLRVGAGICIGMPTARSGETVDRLIASGHTYEQDDALWLRTTDFGDDKDRVMRKSDGTYTYFVPGTPSSPASPQPSRPSPTSSTHHRAGRPRSRRRPGNPCSRRRRTQGNRNDSNG